MAQSKKLNLKSTSDFAQHKVTLLIYGEVGSGKTTFASTFPNPVFFVPELGANEMVALAHENFPVVTFDSLEEMDQQLLLLGKAVQKGDVKCNTIVIDNLTSVQLMLQEDLKRSSGVSKLTYTEWDKYTATFQRMLTRLHMLPNVHIIWIAHSDIERIDEERAIGDIYMSGKAAKKIFKSFPTAMLECRCVDLRGAGKKYVLQLRSHDIWTCKIKADPDKAKHFPSSIPAHYDELAKLMEWPSCEEVENSN